MANEREPTQREILRAKAIALLDSLNDCDHGYDKIMVAMSYYEVAHAAGYRAGVEQAAKVCRDVEDDNYRLRNAELLSIAEMRIRALATKEPGDAT